MTRVRDRHDHPAPARLLRPRAPRRGSDPRGHGDRDRHLGSRGPGKPGETGPPLQLRLEATPRAGGEAQVQDVSLQSAPARPARSARPGPDWRLARLEFALPAGVHGIRAFVRDPTTGRSAVVEQRLVVPEHGAFRVSTPVLSDRVTASPDAKAAPSPHPWRTTSSSRARAGRCSPPSRCSAPPRIPPRAEDRRRKPRRAPGLGRARPLAAPPASPLAPTPDGRLRQVVALPQLPGGDYDLAITVEDRVAGTRQEVHRTFSVEEPPAPAAAREPPASGAPPRSSPELAAILDRAGQYVPAYGRDFSNIVAEEECRQIYRAQQPRKAGRAEHARGCVLRHAPRVPCPGRRSGTCGRWMATRSAIVSERLGPPLPRLARRPPASARGRSSRRARATTWGRSGAR